jgi:protein disulfide isomerase-like 2-2
MRATAVLALFALLAVAVVQASNVLDLTNTLDFDNKIGQDSGVLVEYFAPWCGHCQRLAPEYEKLADAFAHKKDKVAIAKVDGDANRGLSDRIGLQGFPTIKWYPANSVQGEDYMGERTVQALAKFVTEKSGVRGKLQVPAPPQTVELTAENFDQIVMDPKKDVLVEFYAPWCGHCKRLAPIYEEVAQVFARDSNCVVAKIDADDTENADIKKRFQISGFPTINFFPAGSNDKWPRPYLKERTVDDFVHFLNEKCHTFRNRDGSLTAFAGRLPALDGFASRFYQAAAALRSSILSEATKYMEELRTNDVTGAKTSAAQYYVRVMERIMRDGTEYVKRESGRIGKLLQKHVDGVSRLTGEKLDELQRKANVLSAFLNERIGQAAERASSSLASATAASTAHDEL